MSAGCGADHLRERWEDGKGKLGWIPVSALEDFERDHVTPNMLRPETNDVRTARWIRFATVLLFIITMEHAGK